MVHTRRMETRIEALERRFEGLLAMRQILEQNLEEGRRERLETRRQLQALADSLRDVSACVRDMEEVNCEGHNITGHQHDSRIRKERRKKLQIPIFDGENAYGWTNRIERYFELKEMNDAEKLQIVMKAMEGEAVWWSKWWEISALNHTWDDFRSTIIRRFQPSQQSQEERQPVEPEKKKEDEGQEVKKNNQKKRKKEKTELGKLQIWSKQNVDLALKMKGIAIKRRKKQRKRTWNESRYYFFLANLRTSKKTAENSSTPVATKRRIRSLSPPEMLASARWLVEGEGSSTGMEDAILNKATERPPPKPPDKCNRAMADANREKEEKESNGTKAALIKMQAQRVEKCAAETIACEKKKKNGGSKLPPLQPPPHCVRVLCKKSNRRRRMKEQKKKWAEMELQYVGQYGDLMGQAQSKKEKKWAEFPLLRPPDPLNCMKHSRRANRSYFSALISLDENIGEKQWFTSSKAWSSCFKQWDPGVKLGCRMVQII